MVEFIVQEENENKTIYQFENVTNKNRQYPSEKTWKHPTLKKISQTKKIIRTS